MMSLKLYRYKKFDYMESAVFYFVLLAMLAIMGMMLWDCRKGFSRRKFSSKIFYSCIFVASCFVLAGVLFALDVLSWRQLWVLVGMAAVFDVVYSFWIWWLRKKRMRDHARTRKMLN